MTHAELQESLAVYRDLRGAEREEVDRHVAGCAECSTILSTYRAMDRNLSDLRDQRPDNRLRQKFYAATGQSKTLAPAQPARRPRLLALGAPLAAFAGILLLVVVLGAWAIWQGRIAGPGSTAGRPLGGIPTPRSAVVGRFVWQTDGAYGYRMLRPAGWEAIDDGTSRTYVPSSAPQESSWLRLGVINYGARYGGAGQDGSGAVAQLAAFEQNPTLAVWSAAMVQFWEHEGGQLQLLRSLPDANIYSMRLQNADSLRVLLGFKVDGGQPLGFTLLAGGPYADVTAMQNQGVLDDFVTMVASAHAIPFDPGNIAPALPPAGPAAIQTTPTPGPTLTPAPVVTSPAASGTEQPEAAATARLGLLATEEAYSQSLSATPAPPLPGAATPAPAAASGAGTPAAVVQAARLLLSNHGVTDPADVSVISGATAMWPDDCLGLPSGLACNATQTPGYLVVLEKDGGRYQVRTDQDGKRARLAASPVKPLADAFLQWHEAGDGACSDAQIGLKEIHYGNCGEAMLSAPLAESMGIDVNGKTPAQYLSQAFAPFTADTVRGTLIFAGTGSTVASAAERRAIAEWAAARWYQADIYHVSAVTGRQMFWQEQSDSVCGALWIYQSGLAAAWDCAGQKVVAAGFLSAAHMQQFYGWLDSGQAWAISRTLPSTTGTSGRANLDFATGDPARPRTTGGEEDLLQFARAVYASLTGRAGSAP